MRKILCATDFSEGAQRAVHAASQLAIDHDAELVIAHAFHVPPIALAGEAVFPVDTFRRLAEDSEALLERTCAEATAAGVKRVASSFLDGPPANRIVELAREDPAIDLVVTGTHGRTGLPRLLLGSVAERIVRHAPCSTLAVRSTSGRFARVLCAIDFSQSSDDAIQLTRRLAGRRESEVVLLHVADLPTNYIGDTSLDEYFKTIDLLGVEMLENRAKQLREGSAMRVSTRVEIGSPVACVLAAIDKSPFHLVVVGSHGRTGLRRAFLGSVAERIVRHASCSVLVARQRR